MVKYLLIILILVLQIQLNVSYSQMIIVTREGRKIVPVTKPENHQLIANTTIAMVGKRTKIESDWTFNLALGETYNVSLPLSGKLFVTSNFGERFHPVLRTEILHEGIDLRANYEAVRSIADGTIVKEDYDSRTGNYIVTQHAGGIESIYCHLSSFIFEPFDFVSGGDIIAISGSTGKVTGPHLHFAIKKDGKFIDPEPLLKAIVGYNKMKARRPNAMLY